MYRIDPMDHTIVELLGRGMTEGIELGSDLRIAEAALVRAKKDVAIAEERVALARDRYERNRALAMDMWGQLKSGLMSEGRRVADEDHRDFPSGGEASQP